MLKLHIYDNSTINYYIDDVVRDIIQDEQLKTSLESTSNMWKVTLPHNYDHTLDIIQADDLHADLYDEDTNHVITPFFTGYVTTSFNYTVDSHGQSAVQITLEDKATHLLKTPYTKDESEVLDAKFSSKTTGDLGIVQLICNKCGLTWTSNCIEVSTAVKAVANPAETCESLLKSVCKEMGYVYTTNPNGQLYLVKLSTDSSISVVDTVDDWHLYESINLTRKARSYRGSRIEWDELDSKNNVLIYRVIEGQDTTHPDCYVAITNGQTLPHTDGGYTYYDATDVKGGSEIFSISNVVPTVHCPPGDGSINYTTGANTFSQYGAKSLKMLMTVTASGHIDKMEASADVVYVKSKNVTYGDGNMATESLHEEKCRWIHDENSAKVYANFIAQYDRYCSSSFSFKSDKTYNLGDLISLNETSYVGFQNYIMITRRSRTLTSYDETNKAFKGIWTYEAVSTDRFNYTHEVTHESTDTTPTTSYTETQPDISDVASIQLYTNKSFLVKDLRSNTTQTMEIRAAVTGGGAASLSAASYSDGTVIPIYSDTTHTGVIPRIEPITGGWQLICYLDKDAESVSITGVSGTLTNTISISLNDITQYSKFLGNYSSDSDAETNAGVILIKDFYLNTTNGLTRECTGKSGAAYTWSDMLLTNAENATKFLTALESATRAGIQLETMSNPNTVSWFNTIIAAKAVIDSLFSKSITLLDPGYIKSESYVQASSGPVCTYDLSHCDAGSFNVAAATFVNSTTAWGLGTYTITCTYAYKSNPHSSEGTDDGRWSISFAGSEIATTQSCSGLGTYGISIDFDGEGHVTSAGDYFTVTSAEQTIPGQGFYLSSDGTFDCNNASAHNLTITGDSAFNGSFNCDVIKTVAQESSYTELTGVGTGPMQAKRVCDRLIAAGIIPDYTGPLYTSNYLPAGVTGASDIKYIKAKTQTGAYSGTYSASIRFYDASFNEVDIKNYFEATVTGGNKVKYIWSNDSNPNREQHGMWVDDGRGLVDGISIRVYTGGNALELNIPDQYHASGLTSNQLFYGTQTTVNNIPCYPIYLKA